VPKKRKRVSYNDPGHAHELTFSTYRRTRYFLDPDNCALFLAHLDVARKRLGIKVWAYVVMPEHVHLFVYPGVDGPTVAEVLKAVKQPFSREMGALGRRRHDVLWQPGGGYDRNVHSRKTAQSVVDYIHMNPVRRGLCESPQDYAWSSAASWYGTGKSPLVPDVMDWK
jgi:putative transposase